MFSRRNDMSESRRAMLETDTRASASATAETVQVQSTPAQREAAPDVAGRSALGRSVILDNLVIKGSVTANGALELHGLVEGDVAAQSVVVGPTATVRGDIVGASVSIDGDVRGTVVGRSVHLGAQARYQGEIRHAKLAIDAGAEFEGAVKGGLTEEAWARAAHALVSREQRAGRDAEASAARGTPSAALRRTGVRAA